MEGTSLNEAVKQLSRYFLTGLLWHGEPVMPNTSDERASELSVGGRMNHYMYLKMKS